MIIKEGDTIVLIDESGKKTLVRIDAGGAPGKEGRAVKMAGIGVVDISRIIGKPYGSKARLGSKEYYLMRPSITDKIETMKRGAQIILPKDSSAIIMHADIKPGDSVLESGIGSGAMTAALANAVGPSGKVVVYENREEFAKLAADNLGAMGLLSRVEIKIGDVTAGISEKGMDAAVLDIPNPWDAIGRVKECLKPCASLASYSPTVNQVERTVKELEKTCFIQIRTIELLEREIVVGERGTRPSFDMLGHTGYITFARKVA